MRVGFGLSLVGAGGMQLGFENETKKKKVGTRTHKFVCSTTYQCFIVFACPTILRTSQCGGNVAIRTTTVTCQCDQRGRERCPGL